MRRGRYDDLRRSSRARQLRREHIVFTEGKTEKVFLEGVRKRYRLSNVQVVVIGQVGEPGHIVRRAEQEMQQREGRQGEDWLVHVVFDRDEHAHFDDACERARRNGFVLGVSVPCFELWLILLKADQTAALSRHVAQRRCRDLHPGFCHDSNPIVDGGAILDQELREAARRSQVLEDRAEGSRFANPSSTFSKVLDAILSDLPGS